MKNKHILLVWEEVSTTRKNIYKKLRRFMRIFLLLLFLYSFIYITSPLRGEKIALIAKSYPLSEMSRTLLRMKAFPSNAAFCKQLITMAIPMVFRWFSSSSLTVPKAPTTIGITVALTSYKFCTCNLNSWYLVIFSSFFTLMF